MFVWSISNENEQWLYSIWSIMQSKWHLFLWFTWFTVYLRIKIVRQIKPKQHKSNFVFIFAAYSLTVFALKNGFFCSLDRRRRRCRSASFSIHFEQWKVLFTIDHIAYKICSTRITWYYIAFEGKIWKQRRRNIGAKRISCIEETNWTNDVFLMMLLLLFIQFTSAFIG